MEPQIKHEKGSSPTPSPPHWGGGCALLFLRVTVEMDLVRGCDVAG